MKAALMKAALMKAALMKTRAPVVRRYTSVSRTNWSAVQSIERKLAAIFATEIAGYCMAAQDFGSGITQRLAGPEKARDLSAGAVTSTTTPPWEIRRIFSAELFRLVVSWPALSGVLFAMVGPGLLIGYIERWRLDEALYFTFVTGLTIGYGDLTPRHVVSRLLAVMIGFAGIVLTGLVAAVSVEALRAATRKSTD